MESLLIIIAIVLSVALGFISKINTGFFAMIFAYIIGCLVLDFSASTITSYWPLSIFFTILGVSLFYNFAVVNGTLEKLSAHILYRFRKHPVWIPIVLYFVAVLIAAMGASYFAVMALVCPIAMVLCDKTGSGKLTGVLAATFGALGGANFMSSMSGLIFRGIMEPLGYVDEAFAYCTSIWAATFIHPIIILLAISFFAKKRGKLTAGDVFIEAPEKFSSVQKKNLVLIVLLVVIVLAAPILHMVFPSSELFSLIADKMDVGYAAIILSVVALFMKLGDEKSVVAKVPWGTLIMICGVGMLIQLAVQIGTIDLLGAWLGGNIPAVLMPLMLTLVGFIMSFFSSTLGVVCPALFPLVPALAAQTGVDPMIMFTCIVMGAQVSGGVSPFSSGGSLALSSCSDESERNKLYTQLLISTPVLMVWVLIIGMVYGFIMM